MYSATSALIAHLRDNGWQASTQPPRGTGEFVTVERTSAEVIDLVDHPTYVVQTWAPTETRAEEMALLIRELLILGERPEGFHAISAENGPYPWWDDETRMPRYQTVYACVCQLTQANE